jgi:hypothetical protein
MSIRVARRIEIERAIIERLVSDALFFNGYTVTHNDGEALIVERSRDIGPIMAQLHSHDEESLTFHAADGHRVGAVSLVYGNDGYGRACRPHRQRPDGRPCRRRGEAGQIA